MYVVNVSLIFFLIPANLFFFIIIRIISAYGNSNIYRSKSLTRDLFRGFMLASIAKFFFLPIIIWRENITELNFGVLLVLVIVYFLVSLTYIHSTITGCSRKISAATILLSFMINKYIWFNLRMSGNI
jgi:lipid intermediate transporter